MNRPKTFAARVSPHDVFEREVSDVLAALSFTTARLTYHSVMDRDQAIVLATTETLAAHAIRKEADRIAVSRTLPLAFQYEVKTRHEAKFKSFAVDAYQLAMNVAKCSSFGAEVLYCLRDLESGEEFGFTCSSPPPIETLFITEKAFDCPGMVEYLETAFSGASQRRLGGSGRSDAFVTIRDSDIGMHWAEHVQLLIDKAKSRRRYRG